MFQFPGFAPVNRWLVFNQPGCPIRISADRFVCADPRGFSQLIASFIASESLGILHAPLLTFSAVLAHGAYSSFVSLSSQYVKEPPAGYAAPRCGIVFPACAARTLSVLAFLLLP